MAEFYVKTYSYSSKITAKIEFNIGSLEHEYKGNELYFAKTFVVNSGKGSKHTARISIHDSQGSKSLKMSLSDVQKMDGCSISLSLPYAVNFSHASSDPLMPYSIITTNRMPLSFSGKIPSLKGNITIVFEPVPEMTLKEKFKNYTNSFLNFKPDGNKEDFQIVCQGKEFGFNQSILRHISPAFEAMLKNPSNKEFMEGRVEIKDTTPETIQGLKNILTQDDIKEEDLTIELLILADKYRIERLYKICREHLCDSMTKETTLDVIKAADMMNDEEMMSKVAKFIRMNDIFEENPAWEKFRDENPKCFSKMFSLMMFKKK